MNTLPVFPGSRISRFILIFGFIMISLPVALRGQGCDDCVYYDVNHLSRVEGHPDLGDWDELWTLCVPFDDGRDFRVTADGMTASKFEVSLVVEGECIYDNTDPMVEFIDENLEVISDPTPEEHGIIEVVGMSETTVFFEYTHPTDLPPAGEKFRQVRILIKDYSPVTGEYSGACWLVINIYRPPVLLVHGLWSNSGSFEAMAESMTADEYEEQMVVSANYAESNAAAFSTNADVVPSGINLLINQCRDSYMSAGKVNLVGHSMGGILSRQYLQNGYGNDVYRIITCNTPHSGSQAASFLLDPAWSPTNDSICSGLAHITYYCYDGAIEDLGVNSAAIIALNSGVHPADVGAHALVTTKELPTLSVLGTYFITWSELLTTLIYLSNTCGQQILDTLYNGDYHDLVVALDSQTGGLSGAKTTIVADQMHIGSTANPAVIDAVKDLLNEPFDSDKFTNGGYAPLPIVYNSSIGCDPLLNGKPHIATRSSSALSFGFPPPSQQTWTSGDTAEISVSGPGIDTLVLVFKINNDTLFVEKLPGPDAVFHVPIPDGLDGTVPIMVFGYSADEELSGIIADTTVINPAFSLTGISVFPTKIFSNVGDTTDFQVIGHYDDAIDRSLNGNPDLAFTFTTWSASPTSEDDILLNFALNDTLVVSMDTFTSQMVKIYYEPDPTGPVYWLGGTGDWNDDSKWDIGCAPGPANTAYILSGECTIPPLIHAYAKAVEVTTAALIVHGQLSIAGSPNTALYINKSILENNGTLNITDAGTTALWLNGISTDSAFIVNSGDIMINTCTGTYGVYLSTRTLLKNEPAGSLTINNCGLSEALQIQSGISGYTVENSGTITVDGGEVGGVGRILNNGNFNVIHTIPDTFAGLRCSFLHNTPGGIIQIGNIFNTGLTMSYTTDTLINEGQVIIDGTNYKGMWVAHCQNSGDIEIRNVPDEAIFMEGTNFSFENAPSGTIQVCDAGTGIYTRNTGSHFRNKGSIVIDTTAGEGILVKSNSVFDNDTTGIITIRNSGTHAVYVLDNTNTVFNNRGAVYISTPTQHGIRVHGNGAFHNLSTGTINIQNVGSSGLTTTGTSLHSNTLMTNAGRINVALPVGTYGIDHSKKFTNHPCGLVETAAPLRSAGPNFINNGFIHLSNTTTHTVTSTANKIVNNGWIEDYEGLLNLSTHVTNNAVVAAPVSFGGCSGVAITDVFAIGSLAGFSVSDGYTDVGLSEAAGVFNTGANTFEPNSAGILSPDWFFSVTDDSEGCLDTLQIKAQVICPVNCAGDPYFWTGCTDTDWDDPDNWNLGIVPLSTDSVTITGSPAGGLFPEILIPAFIGHLELKPGATLTVKTGGTLTVQD